MALRGTIQDFSLADIFQLIGIQKKTGVLALKSDKETVTVSFVEGQVVGADSTTRRLEDRLGTVLAKSGRITDSQLQEALRLQRTTLKRLGNILVESQFIDRQGLASALQVQISQMVYRLFRWTTGEYNFSQEEKVDYDKDLVAPMSAESILMEGARILDEWPMVEKGIRSFSAVYRHADVEIARAGPAASASARKEEAAGAVTLSETEQHVYGIVDGKRSVQDIVERSMLSEFDTCRTLYELINRQILEEVRVAAAARTGASPAVGTAAAPRAKTGSSFLAGVVSLLIVLVGGGTALYRILPFAVEARGGVTLVDCVRPFVTPAQAARLDLALRRSRLHSIDFAIQVYYLLNRGYPVRLTDLATDGLVSSELLAEEGGPPLTYQRTARSYRLTEAGLGSSKN